MKKSAIAALSILLAVPAGAQNKVWTLSDCIKHALDNNISVKQKTVTVANKEISLNTAKMSRLPGVSASATENVSFGRGLTAENIYTKDNTSSTALNLGANMPLYQGGKIYYNIAMGKIDLEAATADLEKARDDIRIQVAKEYVTILYDYELLDVAKSQVVLDSMQVVRIDAMKETGKASAAQLAQQKATLGQSRLSAVQAANNLELALLALSQTLELPSPEGFAVARPSTEAFEPSILMNPEDIYAEAVDVKPVVLAEKLRLDYQAQNVKLAKVGYLPTLSLNGGLGTNYYTVSLQDNKSFGQQLSDNFNQYIGLSLNIPIFSRMQNKNNVKSAKLSLYNQQLQLENTKKSLYKEIQQAYYNAVASQTKYLSSSDAAASAEASFELTKDKYENGKANITEYNESKTQYLKAASDYLQAKYECLYQTHLLDFYRGQEIVF